MDVIKFCDSVTMNFCIAQVKKVLLTKKDVVAATSQCPKFDGKSAVK